MKRSPNLLDLIPSFTKKAAIIKNGKTLSFQYSRNSFFEKLLNFMFNAPKDITIELDKHGSFVVEQINGKNCVLEIASLFEKEFHEKREQSIQRVSAFIKILKKQKFIEY